MAKKSKKGNAGAVVMCVLLAIALIILGILCVGLYFKKNDPDRYNAVMNELRGVEPTEPSEIVLEMPTAVKIKEPTTEPPTENEEVSFTITAEMAESIGTDNLTKATAVTNADGSVTYTMSKSDHGEMMVGVTDSIESLFSERIVSGEYEHVNYIKHNEDFTEIHIGTDTKEDYNQISAYSVTMEVGSMALMYQNLNGAEPYAFDIYFEDENDVVYFTQHYPTETTDEE